MRITVNGKLLAWNLDVSRNEVSTGWTYEGNSLTTIVRTPRFPEGTSVEVVVERDPALVQRWHELSGFAGAMTRLRDTYNTLNRTWPVGMSPASLIDIMQTGDRLHYHPERAAEEISHLRASLPAAQAAVKAMADTLAASAKNQKAGQPNPAAPNSPEFNKRVHDRP